MPSALSWSYVCYGDGKYVALASLSFNAAYGIFENKPFQNLIQDLLKRTIILERSI